MRHDDVAAWYGKEAWQQAAGLGLASGLVAGYQLGAFIMCGI
mgnify:CR=1 FL=1